MMTLKGFGLPHHHQNFISTSSFRDFLGFPSLCPAKQMIVSGLINQIILSFITDHIHVCTQAFGLDYQTLPHRCHHCLLQETDREDSWNMLSERSDLTGAHLCLDSHQ